MQIGIKATPETISHFHAMRNQLNIPLGEVLRRALLALEASLTDEERKQTIL